MYNFKLLRHKLQNYLELTTLHGLKYIGKSSTTFFEKLFWIIAFTIAAIFSAYFIDKIIDNYNSRVIISLNPYTISALSVPFPTVTICNMNRVNKFKAITILTSGSALEKRGLCDLCNDLNVADCMLPEVYLTKNYFINFTMQVSPTCEDMIKACFWKNKAVNCSVIFNDVMTDIGACCVFNQLSLNHIFRQTNLTNKKTNFYFEEWNFEKSYNKNTTNMTIPLKLKGSGLTLVLDADLQNYFCSSSNSVGFKILTSNPVEMSLVKNYGIHVPTGYQSVISLKPTISDAKKSLQHESYLNRWCYFNEERYLRFFKTYTFRNCITECRINYTLEKCNCIPYYMISNSTADMCEQQNLECIYKVQDLMTFNEKPMQKRSKCHCLPNCNEYSFSERISYNRLTFNRLFYMVPANKIIENRTRTEFLKSAAVVKLYYEKSVIERSTKNDIYDIFEFLSNMGGLLCIFLGFSFLSGAEIVYHLLCAILPVIIQIIKDNAKKKNVLPFIK